MEPTPALVWTQYQYFVFPIIFGVLGVKLLLDDWRHSHGPSPATHASVSETPTPDLAAAE